MCADWWIKCLYEQHMNKKTNTMIDESLKYGSINQVMDDGME